MAPEVGVVDLHVVLTQPPFSLFLRESAAAVLERGEDGGRDVVVVGQDGGAAADSARQQFSGLERKKQILELKQKMRENLKESESDGRIDRQIERWTSGVMDTQTNGGRDKWTHRRMERQKESLIGGHTDR